jgi:peptidoglycan/LPS O-acetylase OafA/YrhL
LSMMLLISGLLVFSLSIALADLSHRLVTAPSGNLGRRLTRGRRESRLQPPPVLGKGRI